MVSGRPKQCPFNKARPGGFLKRRQAFLSLSKMPCFPTIQVEALGATKCLLLQGECFLSHVYLHGFHGGSVGSLGA